MKREGLDFLRDRAVVDQRALITTAIDDVPVDRVVTGIDFAAGKPSIERLAGFIEDLVPPLVPVKFFGSFRPKACRVMNRTLVDFVVQIRHGHTCYNAASIRGNLRWPQ